MPRSPSRSPHRALVGPTHVAVAAALALAVGCSQTATPGAAPAASSTTAAPAASPSPTSSERARASSSTTAPRDPGASGNDLPASLTRADGNPKLRPGPVTYLAMGDSLTAGDGDDSGRGYVGLVEEHLNARPERAGSTAVNLGRSGWDSTMMNDGGNGEPGQLGPALDAVKAAVADGRPAMVTILIGSNDLWYTYEYGPESGSGATEEDAAVETFRTNLERAVTELQEAGAFVVVGLPDDQSIRPAVADITRLNAVLPATTADEVTRMSALADTFDEAAADIAAAHGAPTVDTNDPFWASASSMADDGIHPNGAGYRVLAARFTDVTDPYL